VHRSKIAIEASLKVVNLVGILDQRHGHTYVVVNGRKEKRCSIVPSMTCEEHFKVADYAFLNGFASATGQVFVCVFNKNGKLPNKPAGNPGGEGYVKIVEAALKKIDGFTIGKLDYDAFMAQLDAAQAARGKDLRKAIDILVKAAANPQAGLAVLAQQKMGEIDGEGFAHVDEAERLAKENPAKAKDTLKQLIAKYAPLECSKRAEAILKQINEKGK
jgi:hypothetical protein